MGTCEDTKFITLKTEPFGCYYDKDDGQEYKVTQYIWRSCQTEIRMIDYGATLISVLHPDVHGETVDVVLGFDNIEDYRSSNNPYMGATVGRVANRISGARFKLGCLNYKINSQSEDFALHGGVRGFDKELWKATINDNYVTFCHISQDGDQGFPGKMTVLLHCILVNEHKFIMRFEARTNKPTIINLTNHAYFNLAGHEKGPEAIYNHVLQVRALKITETDEKSLPTGKFTDVKGTPYDLIQLTKIGDVIHQTPNDGFDDNFCIEHPSIIEPDDLTYAVTMCDLESKRRLEIRCDQLGMQVYTSNYFPKKDEEGIKGKNGAIYYRHGAVALEPQNYPDAINHPNFPNSILNPGEVYTKTIHYIFGVDHVV